MRLLGQHQGGQGRQGGPPEACSDQRKGSGDQQTHGSLDT
jgi:hypothetical protein